MNPGFPRPPLPAKNIPKPGCTELLLADDYAWLRNKENPDVTAYLEAENAYAEAVMAPLAGLREELYQEMLSHVKQTDVSVPYRDGDWWYYSRTEEGLQYGIYCRKRGGPAGPDADAAEEMLLDGNELAKGHAFFAIGDTDITDDGRWLAYSTDTKGFRQYTLRIKDLETGETLADEVERVGSVVWAADNRTLFYTVEDEQQKRQYQLCRGCPPDSSLRLCWCSRKTTSVSTLPPGARATASTSCSSRPATSPARRGFSRRTIPPASSASLLRARTSTSTRSTIATGCGSSAPTIAGAISAS